LRILQGAGADPNATNKWGKHLIRVDAWGNTDEVKFLLDCGINPSIKTASQSPLHSAVHSGNLDCVRLLTAAGADLSTSWGRGSSDWETPLDEARMGKRNEIAQFLEEVGAKTSLQVRYEKQDWSRRRRSRSRSRGRSPISSANDFDGQESEPEAAEYEDNEDDHSQLCKSDDDHAEEDDADKQISAFSYSPEQWKEIEEHIRRAHEIKKGRRLERERLRWANSTDNIYYSPNPVDFE
jgi:ankyrin repeat protein